jgi:hypothetical protein
MNPVLPSMTSRRLEHVALLTASGLVFALVASFRYLPLTDLPQHALQLSAWVHAHDPAFGFEQQLEINWNTPYLLGYLLARPLVPLVGVVAALKLVLATGAATTTLASARLARVLGLDVWWALLMAPLALGFSFAFGFLNFVLATPLIIAALAECVVFLPRWGPTGGDPPGVVAGAPRGDPRLRAPRGGAAVRAVAAGRVVPGALADTPLADPGAASGLAAVAAGVPAERRARRRAPRGGLAARRGSAPGAPRADRRRRPPG